MQSVNVYAWLAGQDFNIGDSLLRRPYLRALAEIGPVHVWVRDASEEFLTGLGLERATSHTRSFRRWYASALRSAVSRPTIIALNAGEIRQSRSGAVRIPAMALLSCVARLRGGGGVWLGASIARQPNAGLVNRIYAAAARLTHYVRWREAGSLRIKSAADVGPDWAFAEGTSTAEWHRDERSVVAFAMRGDRGRPSGRWIDWARATVTELDLTPVFVVQVRGDEELARELAAELGGSVLEWPVHDSHWDQEKRVRDLYQRAALVIGDRLHGQIIGATEGAVPIGWVESSSWKTDAHFSAVGMYEVGRYEGARFTEAPVITRDLLEQLRSDLRKRIDDARAALSATTQAIRERVLR